ncbi:F-box/LRR-repeat protein 4 [Tanacetum coccineum]|uniref:F-box/LRR-repeat protein 4 n=1 Tax=Tanacetum coccineum TaxID=301880 RepID=A0ABQ5E713_9ASTR
MGWSGKKSKLVTGIPRLDQVVNTLASGDRGQRFDPHSLQGRRLVKPCYLARVDAQEPTSLASEVSGISWGHMYAFVFWTAGSCDGFSYLARVDAQEPTSLASECTNVGDIGISTIAEACSTSLRTLKLLDCYKLGDKSILAVANLCKNLETLVIGGCRDLSSESINSLASSTHTLRILRMDWCLNVSDASLNSILSKCASLEVLDIGCCEEVTDAAFESLGNEGPGLGLKVLKVSNCPKITVLGISMLLEACRSLEYLDVRSCPHVTKAGCDEAGLRFPESCKVNYTGSLVEPDVLI